MSTCHLTDWSYEDGLLVGKVVKDKSGISESGSYISVGTITEINETPKRMWFMTRCYQYIVNKSEEKKA